MKSKLLTFATVFMTLFSVSTSFAAEKGKAKEDPKAPATKTEPKAKKDTYPLYAKVVAITSRTLTVVRSDAADAKEVKFALNAATEFVNGDKPATADDVKVGKWVGAQVKKAEGDGNDVVLKINIAAKQKEPGKAKEGDDAKGKGTKKAGSK